MHYPTDMIAHTMAFVTPVVEHWVDREITQWVHHEGKALAYTYQTGYLYVTKTTKNLTVLKICILSAQPL